jgi:two-component sensor histidine kinase
MTGWMARRRRGAIQHWIVALRRLVRRYAAGDYRATLAPFRTAPPEVRDLAASLGRMAHTIDTRDRDLRLAAARHAALARELNHRVRNNLQILLSYLHLAERATLGEEGKRVLADATLRVSAIALMHRLLYDSGELATLAAPDLLGELCAMVERQGVSGRDVLMDCDIADIALDIDTAVPLALFVIEAATELGAACPGEGPSRVSLSLTRLGPQAHLEARSAGTCETVVVAGEDTLARAIARQLGGRLEALPAPATGLVLIFSPRGADSEENLLPQEH